MRKHYVDLILYVLYNIIYLLLAPKCKFLEMRVQWAVPQTFSERAAVQMCRREKNSVLSIATLQLVVGTKDVRHTKGILDLEKTKLTHLKQLESNIYQLALCAV